MANRPLVHLDTDLGGDLDDLCALALLLRWPGGVGLSGITTVGDEGGRRAGYVRYALGLAGRDEAPVAAGADVSGGTYRWELGLPPEERYWPEPIRAAPGDPDTAVELLRRSLDAGAVVIGIGPFTNLRLVEEKYPGILSQAKLFLLGGFVYPPRAGFPQWDHEMDFNIQADVRSAQFVLERSNPTLIPLSVTVETALRRAYLDDLRRAGAFGELLAHQAEAFAEEYQNEAKYGATCTGLPEDTINFQHDPLACAVALGWEGVKIEALPLRIDVQEGWLMERVDPGGKVYRVVTEVEGEKFNRMWSEVVGRPSPLAP